VTSNPVRALLDWLGADWPVAATAVVIPVLVTIINTVLRRHMKVATSTSTDLFVGLVALDLATIPAAGSFPATGVPQSTLLATLVILGAVGLLVLIWATAIQKLQDERAFWARAYSLQVTTSARTPRRPLLQQLVIWVLLNALLATHVLLFLAIAR